jgi:hypothetical protein
MCCDISFRVRIAASNRTVQTYTSNVKSADCLHQRSSFVVQERLELRAGFRLLRIPAAGFAPPSYQENNPMRIRRVSVGMIMAIVVLLAAQFAVVRHFLFREGYLSALYIIPVVTVLGLGALFVARDLYREGETTPFLVGFEFIGGAMLCYTVQLSPIWVRFTIPVAELITAQLPLLRGVRPAGRLLVLALCSVPILLLALAGGWLATRIGLTLVIKQKDE